MKVVVANHYNVQRPSLFSRAILTYYLVLSIVLSDEELAIIEQRNLYDLLIYQPPEHPRWKLPEDEKPAPFLVKHLVQLHYEREYVIVGYYADDHALALANDKLRGSLEEFKKILARPRSSFDEYEL